METCNFQLSPPPPPPPFPTPPFFFPFSLALSRRASVSLIIQYLYFGASLSLLRWAVLVTQAAVSTAQSVVCCSRTPHCPPLPVGHAVPLAAPPRLPTSLWRRRGRGRHSADCQRADTDYFPLLVTEPGRFMSAPWQSCNLVFLGFFLLPIRLPAVACNLPFPSIYTFQSVLSICFSPSVC